MYVLNEPGIKNRNNKKEFKSNKFQKIKMSSQLIIFYN